MSVLGGFFNSVALVIVLLVFDWRIGFVAAAGVLIYLAAAELALRKSAALSGVRQNTQESLVESVFCLLYTSSWSMDILVERKSSLLYGLKIPICA